MIEKTQSSRTYDLVEELRADIDFELEDVITEIVRELPEDYFQRVRRKDQLIHLKALLALSFCKLQEELMFRSSDGVHTAVIARQNYSGQLASILKRMPTDRTLTGAKIFTSRNHDFIIDLFEFELDDQQASGDLPVEEISPEAAIKKVAAATEEPPEVIREFVSHYSPTSQILDYPDDIAEHFYAAGEVQKNDRPSIRVLDKNGSPSIKLTVASRKIKTRQLVQLLAEYLGEHQFDIEKAYLNDLKFEQSSRIAIASFEMTSQAEGSFDVHQQAIEDLLIANIGS